MDNPLSKLALEHWYQVLIVVCIGVFLLCGAGLLPAFPTAPTAFISLGGFFIGLGEWINHPLRTRFHPVGIVRGHPRHASVLGNGLVLLGLGLVALGLFRLLT